MAESLGFSRRDDLYGDTDEEEYDEYCDNFAYSVSFFPTKIGQTHQTPAPFRFIQANLSHSFSSHGHVVYAMDIMDQISASLSAAHAMHFYFH